MDLNKTLSKAKTINPWGFLSLILFIVIIAMIGYFGIVTLQSKKLANVLADRQQTLIQEQMKLTSLKSQSSYIRFQASDLITKQFFNTDWIKRYEYLVIVLNMLRDLDQEWGDIITFTNINVQDQKISLMWEVANIQSIYNKNGLIDQFIELDFVEHITIPFYRNSGDFFEFILDATIKPYDTVGGKI